MNTRKIILLTVPVIVVVLLALAAILTLVFTSIPAQTASASPAAEAVQEQMAPPAVLTPEAGSVEGSGKPKVIYENQ